jgi:hypothetical protein
MNYINNLDKVVKQNVKIIMINGERMAVKILSYNDTRILVINRAGYRSLLNRDNVAVVYLITPDYHGEAV